MILKYLKYDQYHKKIVNENRSESEFTIIVREGIPSLFLFIINSVKYLKNS